MEDETLVYNDLMPDGQDTEHRASRTWGAKGEELGVRKKGGEIRTDVYACLCEQKSRRKEMNVAGWCCNGRRTKHQEDGGYVPADTELMAAKLRLRLPPTPACWSHSVS